MYSNFLLGNLQVTQGARIKLKRVPYDLIARHAVNDHGLISKREGRSNLRAMETIGRIKSRFPIDPTDLSQGSVLVITSETWDQTLVLLEEEEEKET